MIFWQCNDQGEAEAENSVIHTIFPVIITKANQIRQSYQVLNPGKITYLHFLFFSIKVW